MIKHAIIVDPLAGGRFLPDEFAERGIPCIAVLSAPVPADFGLSFYPDKFARVFSFDGDLEALVGRLADYAPACVMIGLETGVELADRLARHLGLPGNDPRTSERRCDKFVMQETLHAQGMRAIPQARVADVDAARSWLAARDSWPVIVKPTNSAGSDGVTLCHTIEQALGAVDALLGAVNLLGHTNHSVLLQHYLQGREWVVDTVSCDGRHVVTNVTRYLKQVTSDGNVIYRHCEYLSPADPAHAELIAYALGVNDALEIRFGSAHHEIIITDDGPTLVEVNPRMHGADASRALRWCFPVTQIDLSVDAYVDPTSFDAKAAREFRFTNFMIAHYLISGAAGTISAVASGADLDAIPSFRLGHLPPVGKRIGKTVSLTSAPGYIWLVSEDEAALWRDQKRLIAMEERGALYAVAPD
jgi:hypothetical protein